MARVGVKDLNNLVLPCKILSVFARGKSIFIELEGDYSLVSTLGMSGWWYPPSDSIKQEDLDDAYYSHVITTVAKAEKHTRLQLVADDSLVNYVDPRNFGNFYVLTQKEFQKRKSSFGPDFLNDELTIAKLFDYVKHALYQTNKPIGEVLLNQSILAGLGNIYRAETMYLAKISPHRPASSLTDAEIWKLLQATELVLVVAYNGRGHMSYPSNAMMHFLRLDGQVNRHLVYGCNIDVFGNTTKSETIGGRTCWWTPSVQS